MGDYNPKRWLARQLAWENALDRLRREAGIVVPGRDDPPERVAEPERMPSPDKAA